MPVRDTFCSYCGTKYPEPLVYPRTCPGCTTQVWANPIPVSVVLVPVDIDASRTVVRRAIESDPAGSRYFTERGITGAHAFTAY